MATAPSPSPSKGIGAVVVWARQNLFSSPLNTLLTALGLWLLWLVLPPVIQWLWLQADFSGSSRADGSLQRTGPVKPAAIR